MTIGGTAAGEGNVIAYNGGWAGSRTDSENPIRGNRIFDNGPAMRLPATGWASTSTLPRHLAARR